jgi:hypothetical protein
VVVAVQEMLVTDIRWREEFGLLAFQSLTLEEVVGMPEAEFVQFYWSQLLGYDDTDNMSPVIYRWWVLGAGAHAIMVFPEARQEPHLIRYFVLCP